MQLIRTGRQLGQAVKNVQRLRHIIGVFSRHGFADLVTRMDLGRFMPSRITSSLSSDTEKNPAIRLREAFETLGPTFVKLGQLLSTRPDVMPDAFVEELVKLQDNVKPLPYEAIRKVVEAELKKPIDSAFASFNPEPLASASIAQVHEAKLHTGELVVVKVQRPDIKKIIETDISLLAFLAGMLEKYVPESRIANPSMIVDEFFRTLSLELDFAVEANNLLKIAENMSSLPEIVIPRVYKHLSTQRILTQEKLMGIRLSDPAALTAAGVDKSKIVQIGARAFFKSVMVDGLFHGDLHGGNLFALPGDRLGIIDFGIVGRLSRKARGQLANMVLALASEDFENLCYQYAELGAAEPSVDFESFQREVQNAIAPYMGLTLSEVNAGRVLIEATKIATKHHIRIPSEWMVVFKAILTTEGMGRSLDPDFDLLSSGQELVKEMVKSQYSLNAIRNDLIWSAKDVLSLFQTLPRQIRWMFRKLNSNDFAFEIKSEDLRDISQKIEKSGRRTSLSLVIGSLLIASSVALQFATEHAFLGLPTMSVIYLSVAIFLLMRLWWL